MKRSRIVGKIEFLRSEFEYEKEKLIKLNGKIAKKFDEFIGSLVECDKCGCLLKKGTAIRGQAEIRQRYENMGSMLTIIALADHIYYPYYCKVHAPKEKK